MEAVFLTRVLYRNSNWDLSSLLVVFFAPFFLCHIYVSREGIDDDFSSLLGFTYRASIYSHHRPIKRIYFLY